MKAALGMLVGLLAFSLAAPAASARGGGPHYVAIPIILPGRLAAAGPFTPNPGIDLPLEVTDAPVQRQEGVVGLHEAIAQHTIRAASAIVVDQPIEGGRRPIPAGSVLTQVFLTKDGRQTVLWCDMRTYGSGGDSRFDCFSDLHGGGKLDGRWSSLSSDEFLGFGGDESIDFKGEMTPVPFHDATPDQRPTGLIGYEWCGGGAAGPPRFEVTATFAGGYWEESETHACPFGQWTDASKTIVSVDALLVQVRPGPQQNTLAFKVEGRIPPELIAHLEPGGPIRSRADADAGAAIDQAALTEQSLAPTGSPANVASGEIPEGAVIFSMGVKHGVTGVLKNDIWLGRYVYFVQGAPPDAPSLKAGQLVYARLVSTAQNVQVVWCAPRKSDAGVWTDAVCFLNDGTGYVWVVARPVMLVGPLLVPEALRPYATPPIVARQSVDLPPMTLSYVFKGWSDRGANIEAQVDWGAGPQTFRTLTIPPEPDGAAAFAVFSGVVLIRHGETPDSADISFKATQ